jgi:hypothetical protein
MSQGMVTPWNVLSDKITKKVQEHKAKQVAAQEQEEQTEFAIRMGAINDALSRPDDPRSAAIIDQAIEQMKKHVPKTSIPIIDAYHQVAKLFHKKKKEMAGGKVQGQGQGKGPPPSPAPSPAPSPSPVPSGSGGGTGQPAPRNDPEAASQPGTGPNSPGAGAQVPPAMSLGQMATMARPSPTQEGTAAGEKQVGEMEVVRREKLRAADEVINELDRRGYKIPDKVRASLIAQAEGLQLPATTRLQRVVVKDPSDPTKRIPGVQDMDTGEVFSPDGNKIENPEVVSAAQTKPKVGWGKDAQGYYSFNIDPATNQPLPDTISRSGLPPQGYLDRFTLDQYHWVDDSGGVHEHPFTKKSGKDVPNTVPPGMQPPVPGQGQGQKGKTPGPGTSVKGAGGDRTIGTKDTGVLSPAGQRVVLQTQPVLDITNRLLDRIHAAGLDDDNQVGYLTVPSILYKLGYQSDKAMADDIAGLKLEGVVGALSALSGSSRSLPALRLAMQHTPDPSKDSPKEMRTKLTEMKRRLDEVMQTTKEHGGKRSKVSDIPAALKPPADRKKQDEEEEKFIMQF